MKFLKLSILLLFICQFSFAQNIVSLMNKADLFFDSMDKGNFAEAQNFFDESVKANITQDELKLFWLQLGNTLGEYQSVDGAKSNIQGENFVVTLDCGFRKGSQSFRFVFNQSEKLVGFFIVPKTQADYTSPAYVDTTKFKQEEIKVNFEGGEMAGIFTSPKSLSSFPVVVMVHGSGPSDMDATIGANKPFKDLAAGLAARGVGSVRYVKRTMVFPNSFTGPYTVKEETIDDALQAIQLASSLPGVDKTKIYLLGHSLGGMLAPRIAALSPILRGIILAAAPARKLTDLIAEQNIYMYNISGDTTETGKKQFMAGMDEIAKSRLTKLGDIAPDSSIIGIPASYWIDLNNYNQLEVIKKSEKRIYVAQGNLDFQVSVIDFNLWKAALSANKKVTTKLYPDLNHLFTPQKVKGTIDQYRSPGNVSIEFIDDLAKWINQ